MKDGLISVAAGTPAIRVADCRYNAEACFTLMREAARQGVRVLCLPELCLTGYTCGDLFLQETLLRGAEEALRTVLDATRSLDMIAVLGLPVRRDGKLYNCAAVLCKGALLALVPKTHLPNYGEFSEARWFAPAPDGSAPFPFCGQTPRFGAGFVFPCTTMENLVLGVELCEDLWVPSPPSVALAARGATVILNLSASSEVAGKASRRRALVAGHSARLLCGYLYAGAGEGESSTDLVFSGHSLLAENGSILAEQRFQTGLVATELDVNRLAHERRRVTSFLPQRDGCLDPCAPVPFALEPAATALTRRVSPTPFIPEDAAACHKRCDEVLLLAALGLKTRLEHTGAQTCVVGLSGGLDSTLAVLITVLALGLCGRPASDVLAVTMPCFGTTDRTRENAVLLAERLGATLKRIDISNSVRSHFTDIGQSLSTHDVTFENGQARERTQVLMDLANQTGGLVVGTGDLSELALGFCTYNGDHMSNYAVCADIPKTLVRRLVSFVSGDKAEENRALSQVLDDILDTPVSPELLPAVRGEIVQKTEELVGPYELHDFFLYYSQRWGFSPAKILRLAEHAFAPQYRRDEILTWERVFFRRFFSQQFKRSCLPDGPRVGSISLSPRGGLVMPSDASSALFLAELEGLT